MKTIVIPQFYRGPSGQKGLYNRQEVGLARAFAALGCRAVVLYPEPGAKAPKVETPEPNVKICYLPAVAFGTQALYKSWQILLDEQADAVHVMGDNSLGVPGLYRFCEKHSIVFYSQLGALKSTSNHVIVRGVMDLLLRRNLTVYRKTPTYAKTPAVAAELESLGGQDTGYASWFDALAAMEREMDAADYDVAIVGAGAYGLPLAAHARDTGHAAIQMSGATQLLFGIKGKRWDSHPIIGKLYNDAWVRPDETEGITHKEKVEGGSYW